MNQALSSPSPLPPLPPPRLQNPAAAETLVTSMELVRRGDEMNKPSPTSNMRLLTKGVDQLGLMPLLRYQREVAACFDDALTVYQFLPEVAAEIRRGSDLCHRQIQESTKMLRKIEQTACSVLEMFPDLELAISEGEPELAMKFFGMMKGWVTELMLLVNGTQSANRASLDQVQVIVERTAREMHTDMLQKEVTASLQSLAINKSGGRNPLAGGSVNADFLFKMRKLVGIVLNKKKGGDFDASTDDDGVGMQNAGEVSSVKDGSESMEHQLLQLFDIMLGRVLGGQDISDGRAIEYHPSGDDNVDEEPTAERPLDSVYVEDDVLDESFENVKDEEVDVRSASNFSSEADDSQHSDARKELQRALGMLREVNEIFGKRYDYVY